jgi:NAD(P)-dependent dehydrogenase (short-subunit alcohol dehydrogenase family)
MTVEQAGLAERPRAVVVTGASTGIGRATARALGARGFRVFGSVRRQADGEQLRAELGRFFTPIHCDVTDAAAVAAAAAEVGAELKGEALAGLVNNAGIAVSGPLLEVPIAELRRQLEVNLVGQMLVTQSFAPLLGAATSRVTGKGRIVMVTSTAGRRAFPFMGPYAASKFGLEGLAESLRRELMLFGIDVIIVAPGPTATPIWDKAEAVDPITFGASPFAPALGKFRELMLTNGRKGLPPERIAHVIVAAITAKRPKVRYTVTPTPLQNFLLSRLPKRLVDRVLARTLGLTAQTTP